MELTGKCIAVLPARSGVSQKTGNSWMSQEYVLEVPGQYPKRMVFNVFGEDRIKQFNIQLGYTYKVEFDIDANEYQGKWYNKINAWNVTCADIVQPAPAQSVIYPDQQPSPQTDDSDLPF
jgi:hypothetical protein